LLILLQAKVYRILGICAVLGVLRGQTSTQEQTKPVCEMSGAGYDQKNKPYPTSIKINILSLMLENNLQLKFL